MQLRIIVVWPDFFQLSRRDFMKSFVVEKFEKKGGIPLVKIEIQYMGIPS